MSENYNKNIIEVIDDEPRISHRIIAEHTQIQQKNIVELISKYSHKIELYGRIPFKTEGEAEVKAKQKLNSNYRPVVTYYLNEIQTSLLLTLMRNNDIVLDFKVHLVQEFFRMREILQTQNPQIPEITNETEKIIELKNHVLETSNLIEILRNMNPIDLFRLEQYFLANFRYSLLDKFKIDLENQFFLPTELGRMINKSPVEVNLILEHKGYQIRENGVWKMTSLGLDFGILLVGKYNQIKWKMKSIL